MIKGRQNKNAEKEKGERGKVGILSGFSLLNQLSLNWSTKKRVSNGLNTKNKWVPRG